ncbi:MAG: PadR family transcriptional regulator [Lachnospiraceae bacterium]|nr:PadR family transcriptional regulator [Lachnospiraceae bacterium]
MAFTVNAVMLDFLILSVIAQGDTYGYEISQRIKSVSDKKDSTMYPILKRLQEEGWVTTYDQQYQGRNRRYYRITERGERMYLTLLGEWELYQQKIDQIVRKKEPDQAQQEEGKR